jgi:hypothetical protein
MPKYLKSEKYIGVAKVHGYLLDTQGEIYFTTGQDDLGSYLWEYQPATREEYEQWKQSKNKG